MDELFAKDLKNKLSFAIAYSIRGWNIIQDDNEPITTLIAIIATIVPAYCPIPGSLDANNAIGASDVAISSIERIRKLQMLILHKELVQ